MTVSARYSGVKMDKDENDDSAESGVLTQQMADDFNTLCEWLFGGDVGENE